MPEQFTYPDPGWSQQMNRRAQDYPTLPQGEWNRWFHGLPSGSSFYAGEATRDLNKFLEQAPEGFSVPDNHPGIKDLDTNEVDIFRNPDMKGHLFVKPKRAKALTS